MTPTWIFNVCPQCGYATAPVNAPVHEQGCTRPNCEPREMMLLDDHNEQIAHKDHRWDAMRHERDQLMAFSHTASQRDRLVTRTVELRMAIEKLYEYISKGEGYAPIRYTQALELCRSELAKGILAEPEEEG
jgi:hypothetical protein